jgi:hypothetical protein
MERVKNHALSNVTTEAIFKSSQEELANEAAILSACVQAIAIPGYPSSDEDQYKKHMEALMKSCADFRKSIQAQDYKLFSDSINRVNKTCNECHVDYRFGDK